MEEIKRRYLSEKGIYTWCGIALVAVNPYQEQDIYNQQTIDTYHSASHSVILKLDPHVYAVTEDAYSKLERDQSIIVSGESGAGKTVSAKHAMRYLASIAPGKNNRVRIEDRVLASNPIMEAIGNASTVRNDNSSRFGKYIQIYFDRHSRKILGANMRTYLMEKSRVTNQASGERNFHIFYQLANYAYKNVSKMSHLMLTNPDDNNSLRHFKFLGGLQPSESRDDLRKFNEALKVLNLDEERTQIIYKVIAAILHAGNIEIIQPANSTDELDTNCTLDGDQFHFKAFCKLIGLDPKLTRDRIVTKLLRTGRETIAQPLSRQKAEYGRDAMIKFIYECLFNWLVGCINLSLRGNSNLNLDIDSAPLLKSPSTNKQRMSMIQEQQDPHFIGVLDIYGFENFKSNSFEQFCINYANEVLQQQYNLHVFKLEQEEYIREGIDWTFIDYSDNKPVIDVIESKPIGLLNLLDEECRMPKGTDESWCAKLYENLLIEPPNSRKTEKSKNINNNSNSNMPKSFSEGTIFKRPKINYQNSFIICHYAEEVNYQVTSFLEKNRDTLSEEQSELLRNSPVIGFMFEDPQLPAKSRPTIRTARSATVGNQFRNSLAGLMKILNSTEPHYIRCIKPNDEKKAFEFNEERAIQQLKACGVYETIRISNNGFPARWSYKEFAKRYCVLLYGTEAFERLSARIMVNGSSGPDQLMQHDCNQDQEQMVSNGCNKPYRASLSRFIVHLSSSDLRPICEAICKLAYGDKSVYSHLREPEEQAYIDMLFERHGKQQSAIYQFGKTKIFFRAGQVGYLERIRGERLRNYTVTIQRHVRGWLARVSFVKRREAYMEQLRREASLVSLQNQAESLQNEVVNEENQQTNSLEIQEQQKPVSRIASMYQLLIEMMYSSLQPLIISAVLEYEALDQPEVFGSMDSYKCQRSSGENIEMKELNKQQQASMDDLIRQLDSLHELIVKNRVPIDIAIQVYKQIFYLICALALNHLLIRRDLCQFEKAMQIGYNLSLLIQWSREKFDDWREIVAQLDPLTQATKLLQTRKSKEYITTIEEVCKSLRSSQIIKLLNMYNASYGEQITEDFINELEAYLNKTRVANDENIDGDGNSSNSMAIDSNNNNNYNNNDLLMDTRRMFQFIDV